MQCVEGCFFQLKNTTRQYMLLRLCLLSYADPQRVCRIIIDTSERLIAGKFI